MPVSLLAGPTLALLGFYLAELAGLPRDAALTAAVTLLCIVWWIFETIPIPITSLIPLAMFPVLGVLDKHHIAAAYGSSLILLLLGGFMLSRAMEYSGAHRRLAFGMIRLVGGNSSKRVVWGFMLAAAVLSMWIANMATTLMLLPVALAVISASDDEQLAVPLMLGIAYAASVGGMGTPIGTPPNLVFMDVYAEQGGEDIGFLSWMAIALPFVLVFIPIIGLWLTRNLTSKGSIELPSLGQWSSHEKRVLLVFALTALAWVTRKEPFGGWSTWFDMPNATDASVAFIAVIAMFIIPAGTKVTGDSVDAGADAATIKQSKITTAALLSWEKAADIQWGILLLFAGGLCIAKAFGVSGLGAALADTLTVLKDVPLWLTLLAVCLFVTFLTETTSNTASAALLMPILASAAAAMSLDASTLMLPAVLSASCAFMLPVATAPNAIVFSSGHITTRIMAREGLVLNLVGASLLASYCYFRL